MAGEIAEYLKTHFGLQNISGDDVKTIESIFSEQGFEKDEIIFREGEPGDRMFFIREGLVKVYLREIEKGKTIALIKKGELVGELSFFDNGPHSAEAMALTKTDAYVLNLDRFNGMKKTNPGLALEITDIVLKVVSARLRGTTRKMYGIY
jgi:CRP/FNR family transcriptional regulator